MQETAPLEEQFLESQKLETIGKMAGGVAHSFNNMLAAIIGRSDLILESARGAEAEHALAIKKSAERAAALTRQFLIFTRAQQSESEPINLNEVIEGFRLLLESALSNEVSLAFNLRAQHANIRGNRQQIGQMLMNLITTEPERTSRRGKCLIETSNEGDQVALTVSHHGRPASRPIPGLNVSAVHNIVQRHGGTMQITSQSEQGTTFVIRFPLA
jgi:two-component system cell cycle sensor histidine kinase/response regulator CckA